jgi:hypothetical protein
VPHSDLADVRLGDAVPAPAAIELERAVEALLLALRTVQERAVPEHGEGAVPDVGPLEESRPGDGEREDDRGGSPGGGGRDGLLVRPVQQRVGAADVRACWARPSAPARRRSSCRSTSWVGEPESRLEGSMFNRWEV